MSYSGIAEVVLNQKVGPEHFLMRVLVPEITKEAKPGQFVHMRCNTVMDPLLRRPVSLHDIDYEGGTIGLLYQVVGRGTQILSEIPVGAEIDIMGPLGKGFAIPDKLQSVLVIGGGIGVAPLFPLVQALNQYKIKQTVLLGARSADYIIGTEQLETLGVGVEVATDDGSKGYKGYVTDLMEKHLSTAKPDYFFACGPKPMLKQVLLVAKKHKIDGQVSLEERMGCGVGACLACVCKINDFSNSVQLDNAPGFDYKKVCADGPVFKAGEVIFDD